MCLLHYSLAIWFLPTSSHWILMAIFCDGYYSCLHFTRRHWLREVKYFVQGHTDDKGMKWYDQGPSSPEWAFLWGYMLGWWSCTDWLTQSQMMEKAPDCTPAAWLQASALTPTCWLTLGRQPTHPPPCPRLWLPHICNGRIKLEIPQGSFNSNINFIEQK